jgi:molybdopterin-binding protein
VPHLRVRDAAGLLGVSEDTVRRWLDAGAVEGGRDEAGRRTVDGLSLALQARSLAAEAPDIAGVRSSARNRFVGLVTRIVLDGVMAQVELQCGPFRVVSLMSAEAVHDLGLEPGSVAVAVVKATTVIVETPA